MSATVVNLIDRGVIEPATTGKELAEWLRSYADHIEEGDYADACDVVLLVHTDNGQLNTFCTSKNPNRMDTVYLCGLLTISAARKAQNPGQPT